jgi:hypothetical protein
MYLYYKRWDFNKKKLSGPVFYCLLTITVIDWFTFVSSSKEYIPVIQQTKTGDSASPRRFHNMEKIAFDRKIIKYSANI